MEIEGVKADIILVDAVRDKKLSMLKQLIMTLVKGLNSNPAAIIKKIAGLVRALYNACFSLNVFIISFVHVYFISPVSLALIFLYLIGLVVFSIVLTYIIYIIFDKQSQ